MKRGCCLVVAGFIGCAVCAAERAWQAAGDGVWSEESNWAGNVLPGAADTAVFNNALSGDVTIDMDMPGQPVDSLALRNATAPWARTFTGGLTLSNLFLHDAGDARLVGEWDFAGRGKISKLGNTAGSLARLEVGNGGRLTMTNASMIYIGNANNARGQLFIRDGAEMSLTAVSDTPSGLYIGRESGGVGAVVQEGGKVRQNIAFIPGYGNTGYGVYELLGGDFSHPWGYAQTRYRIGMNGPGLLYLRGGTYTASASNQRVFEIACNTVSSASPFGLVYADGGTASILSQVRFLPQPTGSQPGYAELTVAGNASFSVNANTSLLLGVDTSSKGTAAINLNGRGVLHAASITKGSVATNAAFLNFDGGTLDATHTGDRAYFETVGAVIYGGGAKLDSSTGRLVLSRNSRLRRAQGNGVSELTLTAGGSGYAAPPRVTLSGSGGSNATAVAFIDYAAGVVTGLVVTCRGEGYTAAPTVTIANGGGSGATATAAISENVAGPLVLKSSRNVFVNHLGSFDGEVQVEKGTFILSTRNDAEPGLPDVSMVRLNGGTIQVGSSGAADDCPYDDIVNPAAALIFGGDNGGGNYQQPCGPENDPHIQHVASVQVNAGKSTIGTTGDSRGEGRSAELIAPALTRGAGGVLTVSDTALTSMAIDTGASPFIGAPTPVLEGAVAGAADFVTLSPAGTWMKLTAYDDDLFDTGKNFRMTAAGRTNAAVELAANSVRLPDAASLTLSSDGTTVVESGMIAVDGGASGTVITGGRLTSGNGRDLVMYDAHTNFERRNTSAANQTLRIESTLVDNGATPVALVATGPADTSTMLLARGNAVVLAQATNEYSGGTFIIDAALEAAEDRSLGAVPAAPCTNIVTSGMALLRAKKSAWPLTLHANRGICLKGGCLALIGDDSLQQDKVIMAVNGPVSGRGVLVLNHWTGGGVGSVITLSGDQSAFEGTYAVHGVLRLTGDAALPPFANLALCENHDAGGGKLGGVVEMLGVVDRAPGTGPGQVQWSRANSLFSNLVGDNNYAESGGFSAYGGPLTINLGGDKRTLTVDQNGFNLNVLRLQTDAATHDLTWENGLDLAGKRDISLQIGRTSTSKRVFWRGPILNSGATRRTFVQRQNGKLILCDGADVGTNLAFSINNSLQCQITNRQTLACDFRGGGPITKWGDGITVVTGVSSNTGMMRLYEGTWIANGTHMNAGNYMVSNNAVLGGFGVIVPSAGNSVTVNGTLAPGAAGEASGLLTFGSTEQGTALNLNGVLAVGAGASEYDSVAVFGDVAFGEGAVVAVTALDNDLWLARRGDEMPVLTWTGAKTGTWSPASALPTGWKIRERADGLYLSYAATGTLLMMQ